MLKLNKYFKKCEIVSSKEIEQEYSSRLILNAKRGIYNNIGVSNILEKLNKILETRLSLHPLDVIGCLYIMNIIDENDILINASINNFDHIKTIFPRSTLLLPIPRNIMLMAIIDNMFLYQEYKNNIDLLINTAISIEKSCYKATINNCRQSDDPPPRNWESAEFIEIYYSSKCGIILLLLSPSSTSCKEFGPILVNKLLNGDINPNDVGFLNESEICPQSQEVEKNNIQKRIDVKIEKKSSNLYQCPACKERDCEYTVVQTRSLDEASGVKCICLACGNKFSIK